MEQRIGPHARVACGRDHHAGFTHDIEIT